jgi:predicted RND superfamily exporter protein
VGAWALAAAIASVGFSWTRLSQNSLQWYPEGHPIRTATQAIDGSMKGSLTVEVLLDTGEENGLYDAGVISGLDEIAAELERDTAGPVAYGKAVSVATVLKEVHQALNGNRAEFYRVPDTDQLVAQELLLFEMSGSDDLEDHVSTDMRVARLSLSVPFADANEYIPLFDALATRLREVFPDQTVTVTGMVAMFIRSMWNILTSMARSYPIAFGVITLLMIFLVGGMRIGLLSMVPNLVPIAVVVGAMGWLDLPFDVSTMLIGSVAIGLVVDDTIHFLHTFAREFGAARDVRLAIERTLVTTGRAIFATSLTLAGGFLVYAAATLRTLLNFGLLTAAIVLLAMLADFLLVPALISIVFDKRA